MDLTTVVSKPFKTSGSGITVYLDFTQQKQQAWQQEITPCQSIYMPEYK